MKNTNKGMIDIIIAMILFSTGGLFIKLIDTNAFTITFGRALIAGLIFLPFIKWKKIKISKSYLTLVVAYCYLCIMFVTTTKMTTAANAIILQCTAPLWLYLFHVMVKGKKITARELVPRIFILLGIVAILSESDDGSLFGNLLALSNGVAYAFVQYNMEKDYPMSDQSIVGINNLVLVLTIMILMPQHLDFSGLSVAGWLGLIFLGVFQIGLSYVFFFKGVRLISALNASIISLLEPILNPILVFIFVGELPSTVSLIGFGVILFGIFLTMLPSKASPQLNEF